MEPLRQHHAVIGQDGIQHLKRQRMAGQLLSFVIADRQRQRMFPRFKLSIGGDGNPNAVKQAARQLNLSTIVRRL